MNLQDATEIVIDTSDSEERELLEAQKPGYYERVWGYSKPAGNLDTMNMEVGSESEAHVKPCFARLQPRTPPHSQILVVSNFDSTPGPSRFPISPVSQSDDPPTTSTNTQGGPTSNSSSESRVTPFAPESSTHLYSPLRELKLNRPRMIIKTPDERLFLDEFDNVSSVPISLSLLPSNIPTHSDTNRISQDMNLLLASDGVNNDVCKPAAARTHEKIRNWDIALGLNANAACDADSLLDGWTHDGTTHNTCNSPRHPPSLDIHPVPTSARASFSPPVSPARSQGHTNSHHDPCPSMSPLTPPPPTQLYSHRTSPIPTPSPTRASLQPSSPNMIPLDPDPPGRAYSLRHRSAIQLNPFAYEKQMYKRQLKGMPEAIVKEPTARQRGRERHCQEGSEGSGGDVHDWENGRGEEGDDGGDEGWRRWEKRREKLRKKEIVEERMRELGLVLTSSSEDELLLAAGSGNNLGACAKRGKKRKKTGKVSKFPLATGLKDTATSSSLRQSTPSTGPPCPSPRPRPRPRPIFRESSPTPYLSDIARPPSRCASAGPIELDLDLGSNFGADMDEDILGLGNGPSGPSTEIERDQGRDSPILVDDTDDAETQTGKRRYKRRHSVGNASPMQILEARNDDWSDEGHNSSSEGSNSVKEVEMTEKDRKRLKALRRMMPAALARKLLTNEQEKRKQKFKERAPRPENSSGRDNVPLQPGRGRKRIVTPGRRDPNRYESKGVTDYEGESQSDAGTTDREVNVVDDDEAGSEEDAERVLEESDEEVDDGDIHTWLAPVQEGDRYSSAYHSPDAPRIRGLDHKRDRPSGGDLIDRMLQRTRRIGQRSSRPLKMLKSKPRGPRNTGLDIVTRGVRRHGTGREWQTKLAFPKAGRRREASADKRQGTSTSADLAGSPSAKKRQEHRLESRPDKKHKKHKRSSVQTRLCIVPADGHKVISGRGRQIIHFDDNDDAFHDALAPSGRRRPLPQARDKKDAKARWKQTADVFDKWRPGASVQPDAFDPHANGGQRYSHITLDFDIPLLLSGMSFAPESYVGKGRLFNLIAVLSGDVEASQPPMGLTAFDQQIDPDMPVVQFSPVLAAAFDKLYSISTAAVDDPEAPVTAKIVEAMMHLLCQTVSFRALYTNDDEDGLLAAAVLEQTEHLVGRLNGRLEILSADGHSLDYRSFVLYWFAVDLQLRLAYARQKRNVRVKNLSSITTKDAERHVVLLLRRLLEYGLDRTFHPLQNPELLLDTTSSDVRTLELWICIFHIAPLFHSPASDLPTPMSSFWRLVDTAMGAQSNKPDSQLDASERIWKTLFSLCAVSQFSVHGLSTSTVRLEPCWHVVSNALRCIRLSADEQLDKDKPASTLQKRDAYLRLVTSRCFLLCVRWNWHLNDSDSMFQDLCAIFRSRNFSNLLGEPSDFPTFIRDRDESLFHIYKKSDTAFGIFLKLIIRAAQDFPDNNESCRKRAVKLGRLLSLAVPVGSTTFTKASPPNGQDLSMLYNRYSAVIVAIYLDPSPGNIHNRLQQARRYITFKDADCNSRAAGMRAMMNMAILFRHLNQPLEDVVSWASEMMNDLIDDYNSSLNQQLLSPGTSNAESAQLVLSIQLLLGSIRVVTETPTFCRSESLVARYPEIGFLQGAWVSRIFSGSLAADYRTGLEIRKCVQSFLTARRAVIPLPPLPRQALHLQEIQDSQDEYGDGGLDLNDPAVLALLADVEGFPDENYVADQKAGEVMRTLEPLIYRLVIKHFNSDWRQSGSSCYEGDEWVECWLGCASILVRHKKRDWTWYIKLGLEACSSIHDRFWRRRMRLRVMLAILQLDPAAYKLHEYQFLEVWFESIISPDITIEHDFAACLFTVDGLRHSLFRGVPCVVDPNTGIFTFEVLEFEQLRSSIIDVTLDNVAKGLENDNMATEAACYVSLIVKMLDMLRDRLECMGQNNPRRSKYTELCKRALMGVRRHPALMQQPSLHDALNWDNFL